MIEHFLACFLLVSVLDDLVVFVQDVGLEVGEASYLVDLGVMGSEILVVVDDLQQLNIGFHRFKICAMKLLTLSISIS